MSEPRELTTDEIKMLFLRKLKSTARYWAGLDGSNVPADSTILYRIEGAYHSLLATLDGCAGDLPGFIVAPHGDPSDVDYYKTNGKNWFPVNDSEAVKADIGGSLHELLHKA